jgi:hypothetical protein
MRIRELQRSVACQVTADQVRKFEATCLLAVGSSSLVHRPFFQRTKSCLRVEERVEKSNEVSRAIGRALCISHVERAAAGLQP